MSRITQSSQRNLSLIGHSTLLDFFPVIKLATCMTLDDAFATAVLQDGLPFSAGQIEIRKCFWALLFGDGY